MNSPGQVPGMLISVRFDSGLLTQILNEGGVPAWNAFVADMFDRGLIDACWAPGERPPPFDVDLDLSGLRVPECNLDGIDLRSCWMEGANLDRASLRGARIGCCPHSSFRHARLDRAAFCDISGCDFTAASMDGVVLDDATYHPANPPVGLPPELQATCRADPDSGSRDTAEGDLGMNEQSQLCCRATVHMILPGE